MCTTGTFPLLPLPLPFLLPLPLSPCSLSLLHPSPQHHVYQRPTSPCLSPAYPYCNTKAFSCWGASAPWPPPPPFYHPPPQTSCPHKSLIRAAIPQLWPACPGRRWRSWSSRGPSLKLNHISHQILQLVQGPAGEDVQLYLFSFRERIWKRKRGGLYCDNLLAFFCPWMIHLFLCFSHFHQMLV